MNPDQVTVEYEIQGRVGPGDRFTDLGRVEVKALKQAQPQDEHKLALRAYWEDCGGQSRCQTFLVRRKGDKGWRLWALDPRPTFMEV